MRVALITSCTSRKKATPSPKLTARRLPRLPVGPLADEWKKRVSAANEKLAARDLYAGRAFTEAVAGSEFGKGGCYVVSAGLGLLSIDQQVPAYSLTITGNTEDNVLRKIVGERCLKSWWTALTKSFDTDRPVSRLITGHGECLFVIALPSAYLELIVNDLCALSSDDAKRIRIIGLPSLRGFVPDALASTFVAYDERIEAAGSGYAGTRADFPQRAAHHFISTVAKKAPLGSVAKHASMVEGFLSSFERPERPNRKRYTDEMLKDAIRALWLEAQGRVSNGLRVLRRKRRIACEQSRFKRLFWEVAAEKGASR